MKSLSLAFCAFALSCAGQDIQDILQEAISQIITVDHDGWLFTALPYAQVEVKYDTHIKIDYSVMGSGSKNEMQVTWAETEENVMTLTNTHKGTTRNMGELAYVMGEDFAVNADNFDLVMMNRINMNLPYSFEWDMKFNVDSVGIHMSTSVGKFYISNFDLVNPALTVKYEEDVDWKANAPYCNVMGCPLKGNFNLELKAQAMNCQNVKNACAASLSAVGSGTLDNTVNVSVNYSAKEARGILKNELNMQNNGANVFAIQARTPSQSPVTRVFVKTCELNCGRFVQIATLPNLRSLRSIQQAYIELYTNIYTVVYQFVDRLPITAFWFEKFVAEAINDGELNCGEFFKATGAQFPILDDKWRAGFEFPGYGLVNGNDFQEFSQNLCDAVELSIERKAQMMSVKTREIRRMLNDVTSDSFGETISFGNYLDYPKNTGVYRNERNLFV